MLFQFVWVAIAKDLFCIMVFNKLENHPPDKITLVKLTSKPCLTIKKYIFLYIL